MSLKTNRELKSTNFVDTGFILTNPRINNIKVFFISDNNGVINTRKLLKELQLDPKALAYNRNDFNNWTNEIVILDEFFNEDLKMHQFKPYTAT